MIALRAQAIQIVPACSTRDVEETKLKNRARSTMVQAAVNPTNNHEEGQLAAQKANKQAVNTHKQPQQRPIIK